MSWGGGCSCLISIGLNDSSVIVSFLSSNGSQHGNGGIGKQRKKIGTLVPVPGPDMRDIRNGHPKGKRGIVPMVGPLRIQFRQPSLEVGDRQSALRGSSSFSAERDISVTSDQEGGGDLKGNIRGKRKTYRESRSNAPVRD